MSNGTSQRDSASANRVVPLRPGCAGYDVARRVRNARVDRRPAAIFQCRDDRDVVQGIAYARERDLAVAVRGGGAHVAGWGSCDGGVLLDLAGLRTVTVAASTRSAIASAGARWSDCDAATQAFGLALPGTRIPDVGISGHILGGGIGDLSRQFGLACDNVTHVDLVTASGERVRASREDNAALFWALRGGGGNFGVVLRYGLALHPVTQVVSGALTYRWADSHRVLPLARDWLDAAPDAASLLMLVWTAPAAPLVPEAMHFERCVTLIPSWFGPPERADALLAPLRRGAIRPVGDTIRTLPYDVFHRQIPVPSRVREQNAYLRGEFLPVLSDATIAALLDLAEDSGPGFSIVLGALGGAIGRIAPADTAFWHRRARWFAESCAQWFGDPLDLAQLAPALRSVRLLQDVSNGPYVNLLPEASPEAVRAAYGGNLARLSRIKRDWDPENRFRFNANILPAGNIDTIGSPS